MTWMQEPYLDPQVLSVQCLLVKSTKTGILHTVSWIPSEFAVVGKSVKIKQCELWVDGWVVAEVYTAKSTKYVIAHSNDFKKTRKASDI